MLRNWPVQPKLGCHLEDCKRAREHEGQHEKWVRTMNRTTLVVGFLSTSASGKNHKNICTLSSVMVFERSSHQHPTKALEETCRKDHSHYHQYAARIMGDAPTIT